MTCFQLHKNLKTLSPSLKHSLSRGCVSHSDSSWKRKWILFLKQNLSKFWETNFANSQGQIHTEIGLFLRISLHLYFPIKGQQIFASTSTSPNTPFAAANPGLLEAVRVFTWVTYGNFQPTKVLMNIFYVRCEFRKAWKAWNAFWHVRWIIHIHLGKAKLERFLCCGPTWIILEMPKKRNNPLRSDDRIDILKI